MPVLAIIYTILLGLLCTCFVEAAIYALYPAPEHGRHPSFSEKPTPEEKEQWRVSHEKYKRESEIHSIKHYILSMIGATVQAGVALEFHDKLGVLGNGILLGSVLTVATGTCFGISGGARLAKFAVATASLLVTLVLGWIVFLPH